ncbi:class I SAM-dependent methyltransferase [Draconibacterium sediminis]|uniref:class I SAM-dependent methyltransferase n=1 Tax=Draconibacterium sediminis TaxID=1544798 RepID=UPI00069688F6|nr:class I SAM-dependent methyltransferase [Draconibacterium sediminis]
MKITDIIKYSQQPEIYNPGNAFMWTDPHISRQLLEIHLHPDIDLASRKKATIEKTIHWIFEQVEDKKLKILDLGCGPGLYTQQIAQKGHKVSGVDISKNSIDYAIEQAKSRNLDIEYINKNYLDLELPENDFDLVLMIYTDLGVLLPDDRNKLLGKIEKALKPGGTLIFDVLNDRELDKKVSPKNWEVAEQGFWRDKPYITLSESFFYEKEKVILNQHVVAEDEKTSVYRFWTHYFSHEDLIRLLKPFDFTGIEFNENVLPADDNLWSGENVTFCKLLK